MTLMMIVIIEYYTSDEINSYERIYTSIYWTSPTSIQPVQFNSNPYINTTTTGII